MSKRGENIYKRKDGRWEGRYPKSRKPSGAIYYGYVYARSYKKVKEDVSLLRHQFALKTGETQQVYQGTTKEWVSYWLEESVARRVKASTYASYLNKLSVHFIPRFGDQPLYSLTPQIIEDWLLDLKKKLAPSTIHVLFRIVKGCFAHAKKRGMILVDPTHGITLPRLSPKKPKAFTVNEQRQLMAYCQTETKALPVVIALETGLRVGEICALKWSDIDFKQQVVHVSRTVQRLTTPPQEQLKTYLAVGSPKTRGSERTVPLSERLTRVLLQQNPSRSTDFVLSGTDTPLDPRTITYRFKRIKAQLGLPDYSFHTLRHTFATRCVELGVNIAAISSLMGHSSIKMTLDVYTSSFLTDQRAAVEQFAAL